MIDFDFHDQRKELEDAAFLILMTALAFLAGFAWVVVMAYLWWCGV